jgi:hypothetical protein
MHSAIATRNATEMLSETGTQSATAKLSPDHVQQESIKSQTVMEGRVVSGTSDSAE